MCRSIVMFTVAAILSALAVGCVPNGEGPLAYSPRAYPYEPSILGNTDSQAAPTSVAAATR